MGLPGALGLCGLVQPLALEVRRQPGLYQMGAHGALLLNHLDLPIHLT